MRPIGNEIEDERGRDNIECSVSERQGRASAMRKSTRCDIGWPDT